MLVRQIFHSLGRKNIIQYSKSDLKEIRTFATVMKPQPSEPTRNRKDLKLMENKDIELFDYYSNAVLNEITSNDLISSNPSTRSYFLDVYNYNMTEGSRFRSYLFLSVYKELVKEDFYKPKNLDAAYKVAVCYEIMQSTFLMIDDVVDKSITRRGKSCWYKIKGYSAITDAEAYYFFIYKILGKYLNRHKNYLKIIEALLEGSTKASIGQVHDSLNFTPGKCYTRYNETADYKTGIYTLFKPYLLALYLAEQENDTIINQSKKIFIELGRLFQIQDDYLDVFGEEYSGKIGTDIANGRSTWLIITSYSKANNEQKKILSENYGKDDPLCISRVKQVFKEINIPELLKDREEEGRIKVISWINEIEDDFHRNLLKDCLAKIFNYKN